MSCGRGKASHGAYDRSSPHLAVFHPTILLNSAGVNGSRLCKILRYKTKRSIHVIRHISVVYVADALLTLFQSLDGIFGMASQDTRVNGRSQDTF
jgi:hypothetical protein